MALPDKQDGIMNIQLGERSLKWIHKQICESPVLDRMGPPTKLEMEEIWAMMDIEDEIVVAINEERGMNMAFQMIVAKVKWDPETMVKHVFNGNKTRDSYRVIELCPTNGMGS